jgi:hypothetical protein
LEAKVAPRAVYARFSLTHGMLSHSKIVKDASSSWLGLERVDPMSRDRFSS